MLECEPEATTCPTVVRNKMFCFQVNSVITTVFIGLVVILILTEKSRGSRKGGPRFVYTHIWRAVGFLKVYLLQIPALMCSTTDQS